MNRWIDVHTHINFLKINPDEALENAAKNGVDRVITIGTCKEDHQTVLDLAEKYFPRIHCTLGVHPHEAKEYSKETRDFFEQHLHRKTVVAVAEIGLDYYYDQSPRDVQREAFRQQLALAEEYKLPVEIHTRDAEPDTVEILKEFEGRVKGLIHCFTGTQWLADECLALGFNISFSGVVTFKKAEELRDVVRSTPLERLHVETDAPFLTPVPFRGKENQPAYVIHTAEKVAELKQVTLEELSRQTAENARQLFHRLNL